jgi:short-subunit dehydrogenase
VKIEGAVIAITGASSGIGRALALQCARAGADIAVCARRSERFPELMREIEGFGRRALAIPADVSIEADVHRFVDETVRVFGGIDVMVNNAGSGVRGTVEATPSAEFERLMRQNYLSTVYGVQAALRHMRPRGAGVIVNVSSVVGFRALANGAAYAATKAAQISVTESLRAELIGTGIDAISVHPIATKTEFSEVASRASGSRKGQPVGRSQTPEQVAKSILDAIRRPCPEVHPSWFSRALSAGNALVPGLVDRWAARAVKKTLAK